MHKHKNILIELGCEELPVSAQAELRSQLAGSLAAELDKRGIHYARMDSFVTPRRIALLIHNMVVKGENQKRILAGPTRDIAYGPDNKPTAACLGFARSCGVAPTELKSKKTPRGERLYYEKITPGEESIQVLPQILNNVLAALGKGMRWNQENNAFIRPVRWLVLMADRQLIPWQLFGISSDNKTHGHRFLHPEPLVIDDAAHYEKILSQHHIILNADERTRRIVQQAQQLAQQAGAQLDSPQELAEEIAGLTEYPIAALGHFDKKFLRLPREVLDSVISGTQKYFLLTDARKRPLASFICIANIPSRQPASLIKGNEAVIRPRLADAAFFYDQDKKKPLEVRFEDLSQVAFFSELGDMQQKSRRCEALVTELARQCAAKHISPAARLSKCDLLSLMVQEFPHLQGIMGGHYFLADKKRATLADKECAAIIRQHYLPQRSMDPLPDSMEGCLLSLADKLDSLFGLFSLGHQPRGTGDPYGLRRNALGIIRILIEAQLDLDLDTLLQQCAAHYEKYNQRRIPANKQAELRKHILSFANERVYGYGVEKGVAGEIIRAVFASLSPGKTYCNWLKAQALMRISATEKASLIGLNKRLKNILGPATIKMGKFNAKFVEEEAETALFQCYQKLQQSFSFAEKEKDYDRCCQLLIEISEPLALFFDQIMVMVDAMEVRNNRLVLLDNIHRLFLKLGDLASISTTKA